AEESASASEELNAQAEQLQAMVGEFALTNTSRKPSQSVTRPRGLSASDHTFHNIASSSKKPATTRKKASVAVHASEAEKAIPLHEGNSSDDFDEFNS
ncbi:MAG: hypothetical protein KAT56_08585, partial [Sedimentisphaerales bacterium]|nr:hypothetical protein [Sedimentisphaerales bacterium]